MLRSLSNRFSRPKPVSRRTRRPLIKHLSLENLEDRFALAVFTVTNLSDAPVPPPGLDLRQAIALANLPVNAGSTINFSVDGTIFLAQGQYNLTQPTTIDGTAHTIAIDGLGKSRDFNITTPGTVTLTNLTIKNGAVVGNGGGINDTSPNSIL